MSEIGLDSGAWDRFEARRWTHYSSEEGVCMYERSEARRGGTDASEASKGEEGVGFFGVGL